MLGGRIRLWSKKILSHYKISCIYFTQPQNHKLSTAFKLFMTYDNVMLVLFLWGNNSEMKRKICISTEWFGELKLCKYAVYFLNPFGPLNKILQYTVTYKEQKSMTHISDGYRI
jgi:hypothetical protein